MDTESKTMDTESEAMLVEGEAMPAENEAKHTNLLEKGYTLGQMQTSI
jgi:hypothetical protein